MVKIVLPKKIIAKPARGKNSYKKSCSPSKIIANYQREKSKKEKQTVVRESHFRIKQTASKVWGI